jgi:hypothetical protein
MLIDPNTRCPCRSGQIAEICCFPSVAPVAATGVRITGATIETSITQQYLRHNTPPGLNIEVTLNQPYQADITIDPRLQAFMDLFIPPVGLNQIEVHNCGNARGMAIEQLSDSIYAVRYHQRQFLFRLGRVYAEQLFSFEPPRGNASIIINDRPLKAELEAFLFRVTSSMDSLAKVICVINDIKLLKFGELAQKVDKTTNPSNFDISLKKIIRQIEKWFIPLKKFRNAIAHDGDCKWFIGVSHRGLLVNDAQIGAVPAGNYVLNTWKFLLGTVDDVIQAYKELR